MIESSFKDAKEYSELKLQLEYLAIDKMQEMQVFIEELKDNYYTLKELRELLDNWGDHEL